MKLDEVINRWAPPRSEIPSRKKAQALRKIIRKNSALRRKIRDVAHRKNRDYIEEPDVLDYMNGHENNGPTFS